MVATGSYKERPLRLAKTLFFLISMLLSLLIVCAPPLLVAVIDILLPSVLLSLTSPISLPSLSAHLRSYTFHSSLFDIPLLSFVRSLFILCVYVMCDGRGVYLWVTTACGFLSVGYVSAKAVSMCGGGGWEAAVRENEGMVVMVESLFLVSLALAMAHVLVAYRTSCRERRKLLVYRIDVEAVSAYHNDFPNYRKIGLSK